MTPEQLGLIPTATIAPAAAAARASSKRIGPGDIVLLDRKGRRFHAEVVELVQPEAGGRFELSVRPIDPRISYRTATVREVVEVWRRARLAA